jgi:2-haloacid dehalogenase
MKIDTIIFDLGNVLVSWDPANLYRKIFTDKRELDFFLQNICSMEWHTMQDAGRSPAEGTDELVKRHPHYEEAIRAFYTRWKEMFDGPIEGSVQILKELKEKGYPVYALSNWNRELYGQTVEDFPFLNWFDGKIISSEERMKKPDEEIYQLLFERYHINPQTAIFIDDNKANIETAKRLGVHSIFFTTPEALRHELETFQIL